MPTPRQVRALLALPLLLAAIPPVGCSEPQGPVTATGDVPEIEGWRAETVVDGLRHPWGIAWLPDGAALVTERPGRLRIIRDGRLDPTPIDGVPAVCDCGQGGLLDIALHPDFASNRLVYLTFAAGTEDANRTSLARGRFDGRRLTDVEVIFQNADAKRGGQHFGSRILFLPDKTLLMSVGDGGNPPLAFRGDLIRKQAQNLGTHFGKVLRLTDDGRAPADNPFVGQPGARPEVWTYGHRNIQGMVRDPATGAVYANEHGSRGGDELNRIERGNNYGWPEVTYSMEYTGPRISETAVRPGVTQPLLVWTPSKAPSGLAVYTGKAFPAWRGNLLSGALKFEQVRRVTLDGSRASDEGKLSIGKRVRTVSQGPDGGLYLLTDEYDGELLRIVPGGD